MIRRPRTFLLLPALLSLLSAAVFAADVPAQNQPMKFHYQRPPKVITDVLESPAPPITLVSPTHDHVLVIDSLRHPPVSDLAQPMLRLGGLRINPATNGRHHPPHHVGLRLIEVPGGKVTRV